MGICYSKINGRGNGERKSNRKGDSNLKKGNLAGDLSTLLSKISSAGSGGVAIAACEQRLLNQIPGRLFANGASKVSSLYTQQGKKGTNQDAMIVWENFCSRSNTTFCGVFDGHGPYGHMVARRVRDSLPLLIGSEWETRCKSDQQCVPQNGNATQIGNSNGSLHYDEFLDDDWSESLEVEGNEKLPEMHLPLKRSILRAFKLMDKELKLHGTVDCFCSGSTAVTLVMQGQDLIVGNVGDSRAVLATRDNNNSLMAVQLTVDLKPNLPREAERIQKCKGRVFALQDEPEVARVWLPNSDSPGLAMARAFGDFCLKDFGLISVPDLYYHRITERDAFVVLATDGVWDVLSNKEAVDIVASAPNRATAARALVDCATRAWRLKYPTSKTDDCAVVCLFMDHLSAVTEVQADHNMSKASEEQDKTISKDDEEKTSDADKVQVSSPPALDRATTIGEISEIVPVVEPKEEKLPEKSLGQSKRSLAECLSTAEEEEWSALDGITRVNSLLSIPRFLSFDKRSTSWRKWL